MIIKQPYILCCVFPPAGFIGWLIEFTMCLEQHETRHDTLYTHRAYRFLCETCHTYVSPPSHPPNTQRCYMSSLWFQCESSVRHFCLNRETELFWYGSLGPSWSEFFVASIQLMDCNMLDIMTLQIERYSFSKPTGTPLISISPSWRFAWKVSAGTHEVSAATYNGSIGV